MKERKLKVTYAPGAKYKEQIPRIVLQGKWLKELGFEVGDNIHVIGEDGVLTIEFQPLLPNEN